MTEKGEVIASIICSKCGESILNKETLVNGYPSVEMIAEFTNHLEKKINTRIYLSSVWEDYEIKAENDLLIPKGTVLKLSCPKCKKEFLISSQKCQRISCKGQTIMLLTDDEIINLCNEFGCHRHGFKKKNVHEKTIREVYKNYIPFNGRRKFTGIFC